LAVFGKDRAYLLICREAPFASCFKAAIDTDEFLSRRVMVIASYSRVDLESGLGKLFLGCFRPSFHAQHRFFECF
jgi:hypothetical protein